MTFEEALANFVAEVGQMTGRRGQMGRTAPTPQSVPGPTGGPELRSYEPSPAESISDLVRKYIGGTTGERVAPVAGAVLDYGAIPAQIATDVAMQPVRAGQAVANAVENPSLGSIGNAGTQTALALAQPAKGAMIAAGALGLAGADDMGLSPIGEAAAEPQEPAADVLDPDQRAEYEGAKQAIAKGRFKSGAERRSLEAVRDRYETILQEAALVNIRNAGQSDAAKAEADQREYSSAVERAESMRDEALARDVRFGDTEVGKVFNEYGGVLPFLAAYGGGALSRFGTGGGTVAKDYVLPITAGTGASFAMMNAPLFADMNAPTYNPQKEAYQSYARELPPTHPRKEEFSTYAQGLPKRNPVQEQAYEQFYEGLPKRLGVAAIEGATFGKLGAATVNSIPRMVREARENAATRNQPPTSPPTGPTGGQPPQPPGTGTGGSGPNTPPKTPPGTATQGQQGQGQQGASQRNLYQKRGKDGKFKSGFTSKPRGAANQSATSIANLGKSAITKPKTP